MTTMVTLIQKGLISIKFENDNDILNESYGIWTKSVRYRLYPLLKMPNSDNFEVT